MPGAGRDEERGGDPALADPSPEPHAFPAELRDDDEDSDDALVRPSSPRDVGMSPPVATLNLASAICGAGIMALPNAFRVLGLAGGALALLLMHAVTHTTVGFLTRGTRDSGATTYAALVGHHLGPAWRRAVQIAIVLNNFGVMVVYQIIFGDVLAGSRADLRALPVDPDAPVDPDPDRGDYDNVTEPTPPPPTPPPPSHHGRHHHPSPHPGGGASGDPRGRLRALVPWALERAGGSCRVSVRTRDDGYGNGGGGGGGGDGGVSFEFGGYPDHGILSSPRLTGAAYRPARVYDSRSEYDSRLFALSSFANHRHRGHDGGDHGGGGGGGAPAPPPTILRSEWFCSRGFCVFATLAAFVVPLCLCRSLRSLGWASFASVGICVGIIAVAFGEYLAGVSSVDGSSSSSSSGSSSSSSSGSSSSRSLRLWPDFENTDPRELLAVFSVVTTAYVCHFCVHPLYAELRDATPESFARVSSRALTIVTGMYLGVSFAALALFGDGVHADVLLDFARDAAVDQIGVKGSYVAQLALTYPVLFCVMREVLLELFRGDEANDKGERSVETTDATERGSPEERLGGGDEDLERRLLDEEEEETLDGAPSATPSATPTGSGSSAYDRVDRWTHVAVTLGLIGAQFFVAMSTPDIDVALAFLGSTLSVFVAFVAPAAVALGGGERGWTRWKAWGVLGMGACVAVAGLTAATWNVISPPR